MSMTALTLVLAGILLGAVGAVAAMRYQRRRIIRRGDAEAAARVAFGRSPRYPRR